MSGVQITWRGDAFKKRVETAMDGALSVATLHGATDAAGSMPGPGAGVIGKTRTGRNRYRASQPGTPPGVRTNRLRGSVTHAKLGRLRWGWGTNVRYGRWQERGTGRIPPRPWLLPSLERMKQGDRAQRIVTREMRRRLGSG